MKFHYAFPESGPPGCPELRTEIEIPLAARMWSVSSEGEGRFQFRHPLWHSRLRLGFSTPDLGEIALNCCYSAFRKHCMEIHGLSQDNAEDAWVHFDIEHWILTLLK